MSMFYVLGRIISYSVLYVYGPPFSTLTGLGILHLHLPDDCGGRNLGGYVQKPGHGRTLSPLIFADTS